MNCEMMAHVGEDEPACVCEACFRRVEQEQDEVRHRLEKELRGVYRERDRLRAALKRYGRHLPFCEHAHCRANPCTCGLTTALEASSDA